jgi:hypothetical protein
VINVGDDAEVSYLGHGVYRFRMNGPPLSRSLPQIQERRAPMLTVCYLIERKRSLSKKVSNISDLRVIVCYSLLPLHSKS